VTRRLDVWIFVSAFVASMIAHVALIEGLGSRARKAPKKHRNVEMALYRPPPPPPPPPKPVDLTKEKPKPKPVEPPPSNTTEAVKEPPKEPPKPVFGISMSSVVGPGSGSGFTVRVGNTLMKDPEKEFTKPEDVQSYNKPVALHNVTKMPSRKAECKGTYPAEARKLGVEGSVKLELEILADGSVGDVRVVKPLGYGLDEAAIAAMKACLFEPAEVAGKAVITRIVYAFTFLIED
jgi:periplasmic protein TonB